MLPENGTPEQPPTPDAGAERVTIRAFASPLSTLDWLLQEHPSLTTGDIRLILQQWLEVEALSHDQPPEAALPPDVYAVRRRLVKAALETLEHNPVDLQHLSRVLVARALAVSTATVDRMVRDAQYGDWPAFRRAVAYYQRRTAPPDG